MIIAARSDTHGLLPKYPECDVAVHAGDFSPLECQRDGRKVRRWVKNFMLPWIKSLPCRRFIFTPGNHDFACEYPGWKEHWQEMVQEAGLEEKAIYLENESYSYQGKKFFGCPYSDIPGWAFSTSTGDPNGYKHLEPDIDVLIVHQAPDFENLGTSNIGTPWERNFGSKALLREIDLAEPKVVVCGHIHSGNHNVVTNEHWTRFYNVSFLDENYEPAYEATTFTLE